MGALTPRSRWSISAAYDQRWAGSLGISADQAFRKARDHLNLAKARPTSTSHQVAGNISRQRGWYDAALKEFEAAIALDPSDSWSYADLAYTLIWAGRPAEAAAQIETAMRLDPHYPPVFLLYQGLAQFAQDQLPEAARTFEEASQLNPDDPRPQLYLAATHGLSGRQEDAAAVIAAFSAARVRQGGLPFVMVELQGANKAQVSLRLPERSRLVEGLRRAGIPYNFDAKEFEAERLRGRDIDALFFGRRFHGRALESGQELGGSISADGSSATMFGDWSNGTGTARIDGDRLCFGWSSITFCANVFRNPGGTRTKENEFIMFIDG